MLQFDVNVMPKYDISSYNYWTTICQGKELGINVDKLIRMFQKWYCFKLYFTADTKKAEAEMIFTDFCDYEKWVEHNVFDYIIREFDRRYTAHT